MHHKNLFKSKLNWFNMNKWTELFLGLILFGAVVFLGWASGAYSWTLWGKDFNFIHSAWVFLKGGLFWLALMVSILLILMGINDLRE